MKDDLAQQLLNKTMGWDSSKLGEELSYLQNMSYYRYDYYEQFIPGVRFLGSLVRWLGQFQTKEEREKVYHFMKNRMIYVTREQMASLVDLSFSTIINPFIIEETANELKVNPYKVSKITQSQEYLKQKRRTLFIGLSDGSHIDLLRRSAELNNEQVLTTYFISSEKIKELKDDLIKDIPGISTFKTLILVDDFTASGSSYIRKEGVVFKGKLTKILREMCSNPELKDLYETNVSIILQFYIACQESIEIIKEYISEFQNDIGTNFNFMVRTVQKIENSIKLNKVEDSEIFQIIRKPEYFDSRIIDTSYEKGKHDDPELGYNECALPLILFHNTPNNSLPVFWLNYDKREDTFRGLFPRITRHKDEQYEQSI